MKNYRLKWTTSEGAKKTSSVSYNLSSAEGRKALLEFTGMTNVEIYEVKPGE